jgi:enoyl-[acyl-carrier protein] reductase II
VNAGVDFVIVQGAEGGGHTGAVALSVLLPLVVDEVGHRVPIIAAGGVYDGRGLASALCYGAQGVWVGTRFMMSPEAKTNDEYKARLLKATSDDTSVTKAYTGSTMRVIRNPYVTKYEENPKLLENNSALIARRAWNDGVWKLHSGEAKNFDESNQALVTGQNIGAIHSLQPCADIVREMNDQAWNILRSLSKQVRVTGAKL